MGTLPKKLLDKIRKNATKYDETNSFCSEDFELLQKSGYLKTPVPKRLGGPGLSLVELSRSQRLLAKHAPATALAANMHLLWGAVAGYLAARSDDRLEWVFEDMLAGEIFAFGISEAGNELVLLDSFCTAEETDEAFLISGKKIFTTLSPVWTRLGVHAKTTNEDADIVVGFLERKKTLKPRSMHEGGEGITHPDPWDTLGMRATQSWNTELHDFPLKKSKVTAKYKPMETEDPLIMGVSLCFGVLTASVYAGIADRAFELSEKALTEERRGTAKIDDPLLASWYTQGLVEHRAAIDSLERLALDTDSITERDDYSLAVAAMKNLVTDEARKAVDIAIRIIGAQTFNAKNELARHYRDVLAGVFHPRSAKSLAFSLRENLRNS